MLRNKYLYSILCLLLLLSLIPSCSNGKATVTYKLYEMKADDSRLEYLSHPLFSFKYPETFRLVDLNSIPDYPRVYDISDTSFLVRQTELPEISLSIVVLKLGTWGFQNTQSIIDDWLSLASSNGDNITKGKRLINGTSSDYILTYGTREAWYLAGESIYPKYSESFRGVTFESSGLIWYITLTYPYVSSEPPEAQEYFNHIVETFKILE